MGSPLIRGALTYLFCLSAQQGLHTKGKRFSLDLKQDLGVGLILEMTARGLFTLLPVRAEQFLGPSSADQKQQPLLLTPSPECQDLLGLPLHLMNCPIRLPDGQA